MVDVLIIGAGPAGLTAAIYALRAEKSVLLLEKGAFGGQVTFSPKIENFPVFPGISGNELADALVSQVLEAGGEFAFGEVLSLKKENGCFFAATADGTYEAKTVMDLIPDRADKLVMRITRIGERTGRKISIGLEGFPARPNKTTRLRVFVRFLSEEIMQVRIEDKGFGEFFPATDAVIEREFNLVK